MNNKAIYPREFSLFEILEISWNFYLKHFWLIFLISFTFLLPFNILMEYLPVSYLYKLVEKSQFKDAYWIIIVLFAISIFSKIVNVALSILLKSNINKENHNFLSLMKAILNRLSKNFFIDFISIILILVIISLIYFSVLISPMLFLLILIPSLVYLFYWVFAEYAYSMMGLSILASLQYSYSVVMGRWTRVFVNTILLGLMTLAVSAIINLLITGLTDSIHIPIISIFLNTVNNSITSFFTIAFAVFFINFDDTAVFKNNLNNN